eukprot:5455627-Alexandrium_andersonii.AAC.1
MQEQDSRNNHRTIKENTAAPSLLQMPQSSNRPGRLATRRVAWRARSPAETTPPPPGRAGRPRPTRPHG